MGKDRGQAFIKPLLYARTEPDSLYICPTRTLKDGTNCLRSQRREPKLTTGTLLLVTSLEVAVLALLPGITRHSVRFSHGAMSKLLPVPGHPPYTRSPSEEPGPGVGGPVTGSQEGVLKRDRGPPFSP